MERLPSSRPSVPFPHHHGPYQQLHRHQGYSRLCRLARSLRYLHSRHGPLHSRSRRCPFLTGITAGIEDGDVHLDDVIIADSVGDYAAGKLEDSENDEVTRLREIHEASASTRLLSAASAVARDEGISADINEELLRLYLKTGDANVRFHVSKTVCGPFVMASKTIVDVLKSSDRILQALDMEGFGLYLTAHSLEKQALWIKAVCDFADRNKGDDHHKCCSYASSAFLYQLLREKF